MAVFLAEQSRTTHGAIEAGFVDNLGFTFDVEHGGDRCHIRPKMHSRGASAIEMIDPEPFQVAAISNACILTSRITFEAMGGFDRGYSQGLESIDYCLKLHKAGFVTLKGFS